MQSQSGKLSDLLQPGYHYLAKDQFGVSDAFVERMTLVSEAYQDYIEELTAELHATGDTSLATECDVLNRHYALTDELAKPTQEQEKAYCIHIMSRVVYQTMIYLAGHINYVQEQKMATAEPQMTSFYERSATA